MAKHYRPNEAGLLLPEHGPRQRDPFDRRHMMQFTPGGGACPGCHCQTCVIFADDFSSDDLAANWTQQSGSWAISGGTLSTSSSNAVMTCNQTFSDAPTWHNHVIQVNLQASTGNRSRVIFSYVSGGSSTYNYLEIYWNGTSSAAYIKTSADVTIATTSSLSYTNGTWYTFMLCVFAGSVFVQSMPLTGSFTDCVDATVASTTTTAGIGTGTAGATINFDLFSLEKHHSEDPICKDCLPCPGCSGATPDRLYVTMPALSTNSGGSPPCADCGSIAGDYYLQRCVDMPYTVFGNYWCHWQYTFPAPICGYSAIYAEIGGSPGSYHLSILLFDAVHPTGWYGMLWQNVLGSLPDCTTFSNVSVSFGAGDLYGCLTPTGSHVLVSAV